MQYNQFSETGNDFSYPSIKDIENYSKKVKKGKIAPTIPKCPVCNISSEEFKRHDVRERQFFIPVNQIVQIVFCLLLRWRCPACNKRIPQYPDFALPYKRYTLQTVLDFCARYTGNDQSTYKSVILEDVVGYQEHPNDERQLHRSTLWRWIGTLGSLENLSQTAHRILLEADPSSFISRHLATLTVPARKYATAMRKKLLIGCRKLLHLEAAYQHYFAASLFPNLATNSGFS